MNISWYITRSARHWPERAALVFDKRQLTFRELDERSSQLANALLGLGLNKGDGVAIQAWNCIEIVELECALYKSGLVKVPVNARLSPKEVESVLLDSGAKALIISPEHLARLGEIPLADVRYRILFGESAGPWQSYETLLSTGNSRRPKVAIEGSDIAVLHYTSGSTGRLKAAIQTYDNRQAGMNNVLLGRAGCAGEGDRMALLGPLTHASGKLMQPLLSRGATLYIFQKFEVEPFLTAVQEHKITHTFMVPTMVQMILAHPALDQYDLSSLRSLTYGAAPMSLALIEEAWRRIGPVLNQGYGAGETTGGVLHMSTEEHAHALAHRPQRLLSCGRAFGEAGVRVVDEQGEDVHGDTIGEIIVSGRSVFNGYWRAPELTAECMKDGWWHSGDLARVDEEGFVYIVDRKKDMIISGGFNVYTTEVEQALYRHPAVAEACVFGVPDPHWGETVRAAVVLKRDQCASAQDIIDHCEGLISNFKKPRAVEFMDELPKNQNGKVARNLLRAPHWQAQDRNVA